MNEGLRSKLRERLVVLKGEATRIEREAFAIREILGLHPEAAPQKKQQPKRKLSEKVLAQKRAYQAQYRARKQAEARLAEERAASAEAERQQEANEPVAP